MTDQPASPSPPRSPGAGRRRSRARWWQRSSAGRAPPRVAVVRRRRRSCCCWWSALVTGVVLVRRPLPQTTGDAGDPRAPRARSRWSATTTASRSSTATRRRPDAGPGLRARAGALLRDGRAPARDGRPARRDVRQGRAGERRVGAHHGLAPGRRAGAARCSSPRPGPRWRPTPTASTPTSTRTRPARSRSSTPCSTPAASTTTPSTGRPVDSLAWLKAMAWDLRGNMTDEIDRVLALADHSAAQVPSSTRPTPTPSTRRSSGRARSSTGVFEQDATPARHPQPAAAGVHRRRARSALGRLRAASTRMPTAARPRRRHRQQQLGRRRRALRDRGSRCSPTTRTSAPACPGVWMQMGLHCTDGLRGLPAGRRGVHASPACRAW